jgi:hypothetical protein
MRRALICSASKVVTWPYIQTISERQQFSSTTVDIGIYTFCSHDMIHAFYIYLQNKYNIHGEWFTYNIYNYIQYTRIYTVHGERFTYNINNYTHTFTLHIYNYIQYTRIYTAHDKL